MTRGPKYDEEKPITVAEAKFVLTAADIVPWRSSHRLRLPRSRHHFLGVNEAVWVAAVPVGSQATRVPFT